MEFTPLTWFVRPALMALGAGMVLTALRVRSPRARHRAWTGVAFAMLLLPLWTAIVPTVKLPVLPAMPVAGAVPVTVSPATLEIVTVKDPVHATALLPVQSQIDPAWVLAALWIAGALFLLGRLLRGTVQALAMLREAPETTLGLRSSPRCIAPVTIGWLHPVPLLPESWRNWDPARLHAVLIHEHEHARRRDPLVQWLALLNRAIFWFHPLAWWLERHLAALAEEACDAAVLAEGCKGSDYARYLVELARSVSESGARIRSAATPAFSAGHLRRRVVRVLDGSACEAMTRADSVVCMTLLTVVLVPTLACNFGRRSEPSASRLSMAEQQTRQIAESKARNERGSERAALMDDAVLGLTPDRAKVRESELRRNPGDETRLAELVRYYQITKNTKALDALSLWFIAEHPDLRANWGERPAWDYAWDPATDARARELWRDQLGKPGHNEFFFMNAGEYLSGLDNEQAEQIFLEGRRKFPSAALHWEMFLARHYAWAMFGPQEQLPTGTPHGGPQIYVSSENQTPFAKKTHAMLLASADVDLLDRVIEQLQAVPQASEVVSSLLDRILEVDPANRLAHWRRDINRDNALLRRARENPASLTDSDRIVVLLSELRRPRGTDALEEKCAELLALAARATHDANYGAAIFVGNLELGTAALKRGDKAGALGHLRAAERAPASDQMRYDQIDMALPARLVDAGERGHVAEFLESCARFNFEGKQLTSWAAEIRKGNNPRLMPNSDLFAAMRQPR